MRTCSVSTIEKLSTLGWYPHNPPSKPWVVTAYWDAIHNRPMSLKRERRLCMEMGIEPPPHEHNVPACPDCGDVHTGRCHGKPVAAVVTLAPGEVVTKAPRKRKPPLPWVREATANLEALLEGAPKPPSERRYNRKGRMQ